MTDGPSSPRAVRDSLLVALLAGAFWIFKLPEVLPWRPLSAPGISTLVLLAGLAAVCAVWTREQTPGRSSRRGLVIAGLAFVAVIAVLVNGFDDWITRLVRFGIDPNRADMLVQIREAVVRFSAGLNPYIVYHVPWELPLSYGPPLWMWYLVPYWLAADLRFVTIFGHAFVVVLMGVASASELLAGRWLRGGLLFLLAVTVIGNPLFDQFLLIGHTPAYWPLLGLFALLVASGRHVAAAALLGMLVGARTTMVSLVPVFLIFLWRTDRKRLVPALAAMTAVVAITFGPFLLLDWRTLVYGMYGNYVRVIQEHVWARTDWMASTLGPTRLLVAAGWSAYAGLAQMTAMAATCAIVWWRLKPADSPAPWFCVSLTVFSMTTLWPVWYVFLDVFVFGLALLVADWSPRLRERPWTTTAVVAGITAATLAGTLLVSPGVYYDIEPGRTPRWHLRSGFGDDARDETGGFAWATRATVHLRVPRGARTDAQLAITCAPFDDGASAPQTLLVRLNGEPLGQVALRPGVQTVSVPARSRHWRIGNNDVTLAFAHALRSESGETRAARVYRIAIVR